MKKILCPTDFSDIANNGIAFAAKLANRVGAELILFNVQQSIEITDEEIVRGKTLTVEGVKEMLNAQSQEICQTFKISCYAEVETSSQSFIDSVRSKSEGFDLIVMGTQGTDDLYEFFFGSHSYKVAHATKIPLLLIPEGCLYADIQRIVYAYDYLAERKLPMSQATPWIKALKCKLSVLQVMEEAQSKEAKRDLKELQEILTLKGDDAVTLDFDTIHSEEIAPSIHSYMLRENADALALCTHERGFIEKLLHKSVIKIVTGIATYPVFVFHE